jgi:hypothetical protein
VSIECPNDFSHDSERSYRSCAKEVSKVIKEEIGDKLFTVLIDESRDISVAE